MKKRTLPLTDQLPVTARALVEKFDEEKRKRNFFEKNHVRQTFWVRRELAKKLDDVCKTRTGFKTQFVNYAFERCLSELTRVDTSGDVSDEKGVQVIMSIDMEESKELTRHQVEKILCEKNADETCRAKVLELFFPNESEQTKLWRPEKNVFSHPSVQAGNGLRKFHSAEACVVYFINMYPEWKKRGKF